ncbi:MAG: hypothetical protein PW792_11270 [Acidobacteriaceae bacterium]|nr:hypothetical protein [Acidobacteriaceae bacterium]
MPKLTFAWTAAAVVASASTLGAQTLPATPPTSATAAPSPIAATAPTTANMHGKHAYVTFADGMLNVKANNSSLNVILRQISEETGMTITGGVADDRVFGNYGPGDPGTVIATLLGGTGVNVLVLGDDANRPKSLVLTPRTGSATAPSPTSPQYDDEARAEALILPPPGQPAVNIAAPGATGFDASHTTSGNSTPVPTPVTSNGTTAVPDPNGSPISSPPSATQPYNNVNGSSTNTSPTASTLPTTNSVPIDSLPTPSTTPSSSGIVDSPNAPPAGSTTNPTGTTVTNTTVAPDGTTTTTTVTAPNGVSTPEQIYKKLLDLQKARQAQSTGSTTTTTPQ